MPGSATTANAHRVLASSSRVELLHLLQRAGCPVGVEELARQTGRHVNTTREHLERLRAGGFVERSVERRRTRGRPRILYAAVDRMGGATLDERLREHLLRAALRAYGEAVDDPGQAAEEEGRAFFRENAGQVRGDGAGADDGEARLPDLGGPRAQALRQVAALETHLDEMRMSPEVDLPAWQVHLHACPFLDLARERTDVVCSVHLGVIRGVLEKEGGPVRAEGLVPFTGPRRCRVDLSVEDHSSTG